MLAALTEQERQDLLLSVGTHKARRRVGPERVSQLLVKAVKCQTVDEIAVDLELRDTSVLRKFLSLQTLPEEVRALVAWGHQPGFLSFSGASELARLERIGSEGLLAVSRTSIEHELSKEEIRAVVQRVIRGKVDAEQALKEILALRPRVERQYMFIGKLPKRLHGILDESERRQLARRILAAEVGAENLLAINTTKTSLTFVIGQQGYVSNAKLSALTPKNIDVWLDKIFGTAVDGH